MQGFGFVTYASSVSAESARLAMNGAVVEGRKIEVQQPLYLHTVFTVYNLLVPPSFPTPLCLRNSTKYCFVILSLLAVRCHDITLLLSCPLHLLFAGCHMIS